MKITRALLVLLFAASLSPCAHAGAESSLLSVFYAPAGARAAGMGGAFTAVSDDVSSVYWNPAGLGEVLRPEVSVSHEIWFLDSSVNRLAAALPLPAGTIAAELFYMGHGVFETSDSNGSLLGGELSPYDMAFSLAYGIGLEKNIYAGVSLKYASSDYGLGGASHILADAGFKYDDKVLSAGLSIRNLGAAGDYSVPMLVRAGAGYNMILDEAYRIHLSAEAGYMFDAGLEINAGAEFSMTNFIFIRAGYRSNESNAVMGGLSGITAGFGLHFENFEADYAFVPYGDLGTAHRVELKLKIGADPMRSVKVRQQPGGRSVTRDELQKLYDIAYEFEAKNDLKTAEEAYLKLLDIAPAHAEALKRLGAVYVKLNRTTEAVKIFERYLKIKPDDKAVERWLKNNRPW